MSNWIHVVGSQGSHSERGRTHLWNGRRKGRSLWCWIEVRDIGMNSSLARLLYGGVYIEEHARAVSIDLAKILFSRMISSAKQGRDDSGIGAKEV